MPYNLRIYAQVTVNHSNFLVLNRITFPSLTTISITFPSLVARKCPGFRIPPSTTYASG